MDCKKAQVMLSTYMDKRLSEKDKDLLELHLRDCDSCRVFLADLKDTLKLTGSLKEVEPPAELLADIEKEIEKIPPRESYLQRHLWLRIPIEVLATTAVLMLVFVATRSLLLKEFSAPPTNELTPRWLPQEETAPSVAKAPVSDQAKEVYGVVSKVKEAYRDMGISPSEKAGSEKLLKEERAIESEAKEEQPKQKIPPAYSVVYSTEPPKAWERDMGLGYNMARKAEPVNKPVTIAREYNINVELNNLSDGVNELTTQVYNYKGTFITPPATTGEQLKEKANQKEMFFKIPRENYYQFVWDIEKIGVIKKIVPVGSDKMEVSNFVTVHLKIDVVPTKK